MRQLVWLKMNTNRFQLLSLHVHSPILLVLSHLILTTTRYNRHYCTGQVSKPRMERLSDFPKVTHRGEQRLGFEARHFNSRGLVPYSILLSKWGNEIWVLLLQGPHLKPQITVRPAGGIWLVFCCCFRSALFTT